MKLLWQRSLLTDQLSETVGGFLTFSGVNIAEDTAGLFRLLAGMGAGQGIYGTFAPLCLYHIEFASFYRMLLFLSSLLMLISVFLHLFVVGVFRRNLIYFHG